MLRRGARRAADPRRGTLLGLSIPATAALVAFLVAPLALMVSISFRTELTKDVFGPFDPTLQHYEQVAAVGGYWQVLQTSAGLAFVGGGIANPPASPTRSFPPS